MNIPFHLPAPIGTVEAPVWDGQRFVADGKFLSVLEYSGNELGWSEQLTALHEDLAGIDHPMDVASRQDTLVQLRSCVNSAATILEIGCSSGYLLRELQTAFPEATILGADVVREPLYRLAEILPGVPLLRFDLLQCPLPASCVDCIVMLNVLEHIEDDLMALKAVYDMLKVGGVLVIEVPAGAHLYDSYDAALKHFRRYSALSLTAKLRSAGFRVGRVSHLGFLLFPGFVAVKLLRKWWPAKNQDLLVRQRMQGTARSSLLRLILRFERKFLSRKSLPFGIRAVCTAYRT